MNARVPLDVDLEDRLLYGLSSARLGYLVLGLLTGMTLWSGHWAPMPVRATACLLTIGLAAAFAWGSWRGRRLDGWAADIALFAVRTYRVTWDPGYFERLRRRLGLGMATHAEKPAVTVVVSGHSAGAGATTVAMELAACLAIAGERVELCGDQVADRLGAAAWGPHPVGDAIIRVAPAPGEGADWSVCLAAPTARSAGRELLLTVLQVEAGRVCYLDRGSGAEALCLIPEDDAVMQAHAARELTVVAFPQSPAARALEQLATHLMAAA